MDRGILAVTTALFLLAALAGLAWYGSSREMAEELTGQAFCLSCHSPQRQSSRLNSLQIPHEAFMTGGNLLCSHCHQAQTHPASVTQPRLGDSSAIETLSMAQCLTCHRREGAMLQCLACHKGEIKPVSHRRPGWQFVHGDGGADLTLPCLDCHRTLRGEEPAAEAGTAAIRLSSSCQECHRRRPPGHDGAWLLGHKAAASPTAEHCSLCHGPLNSPVVTAQTPSGHAGATEGAIDCSACHAAKHSPSWEQAHAAAAARNMAPCFRCHSVPSCNDCHVKNGL